jgi:hypothetical protein
MFIYYRVIMLYYTGLTAPVLSLLRGNNFQSITDCTCPQGIVTYECTVCGLAIAWEGTALDSCPGGEIALTNRDLVEPMGTPIICNGGTVAAHGSVEDGCLASQLNITYSATLQGRSVRCSVDNGTHASQVGIDMLAPSTGRYTIFNKTNSVPIAKYNLYYPPQ